MTKFALTIGNFVISLVYFWLIWRLFKFMLWRLFGLRFSRHHSTFARPLLIEVRHDKEYYEFRKFKYEQKLQYKLEKFRISQGKRKDSKFTDLLKRLPSYLKVVK